MRLKIKFAPNNSNIDRNTQNIVSWLHKTLGNNNNFHKMVDKSYSISGIVGGVQNEDFTVSFPKGASIFVSSNDMDVIRLINQNQNKALFAGELEVINVTPTMDEAYLNDAVNFFKTDINGIFMYKRNEKGYGKLSFTYTENGWLEELNAQAKKRIKALEPNIDLEGFKIELSGHEGDRIVKSRYKNMLMISSNVSLKITGSVAAKKMILEYGLGHLTGSGYGCVYPTQLTDQYY